MQALGLIETKGLIVATESADAMLKAADVKLLEKTYVGGGLVCIAVTGDVGAVKAAVEAGGAAVRKIDEKLLVSQHIIPRPHEELGNIIVTAEPQQELPKTRFEEVITVETSKQEVLIAKDLAANGSKTNGFQVENNDSLQDFSELNNKEAVDKKVLEHGLEKTIEFLTKMKVVKLRNLAREYSVFGITGRNISKANKELLITEFSKHYENN